MPPDERLIYDRELVLKAIQQNDKGITVSQIVTITGLNPTTVRIHAKYLVAIREAYKQTVGNVGVYYPNGKVEHPVAHEITQIGNRYYSFYELENPFGSFVYVQEKQKDEFNTYSTSGGLIIEKDQICEFLRQLNELIKEMGFYELTDLDKLILKSIGENRGKNLTRIWSRVNFEYLDTMPSKQTFLKRIEHLEKEGWITVLRTKVLGDERLYLFLPTKAERASF